MIHVVYCAERQDTFTIWVYPLRINSQRWPRNCKPSCFSLVLPLPSTINMSVHKTCLCIKLPRRSSSLGPKPHVFIHFFTKYFLSIYCILRIVLTIQRQMRPDPYPPRDLKLVKVLLKQKYHWKQWHIKLPSIPSCCKVGVFGFYVSENNNYDNNLLVRCRK